MRTVERLYRDISARIAGIAMTEAKKRLQDLHTPKENKAHSIIKFTWQLANIRELLKRFLNKLKY